MPRHTGIRARKGVLYVRYPGPGGREIEERVDCKDRKAAGEERARRIAEVGAGTWLPRKAREAQELAQVTGIEPLDLEAGPKVSELLKLYGERVAPLRRNKAWQDYGVGVIEAEFGDLPLSLLTPERVELWVQKLVNRVSPSTVRKYVFFGSGVFSSLAKSPAIRREYGLRVNPFALQLLPAEPKGIPRAMSVDQCRTLLAEIARVNDRLYRWAVLILALGCRVEEAMVLRWMDVDLESGDVTIDGKTGLRYGAVDKVALETLKVWHQADDPAPAARIIGHHYRRYDSPKRHWARAFDRCGLGEFSPRSLRTTFCTLAFRGGARPEDLVQQTGHSLSTLMSYYVHFDREGRRRAVEATRGALDGIFPVFSRYQPSKDISNRKGRNGKVAPFKGKPRPERGP